MKHLLLISAILIAAITTNAQIVNIPDTNFKAALIAHIPVIDTNGDGEIQVSEALATDTIDVQSMNISDLTGIEAFTSVSYLNCSENLLVTLDLSNNVALRFLDCGQNQIQFTRHGCCLYKKKFTANRGISQSGNNPAFPLTAKNLSGKSLRT